MPSATTPLAQPSREAAGKAAEGEPRVRRPAARRVPLEPLAEGGFVPKLLALLVVLFALACSSATAASSATPRRIVSLSPTATETLYALGAGDQVIAVDNQSDYPKAALAKKTSLSGFSP